MNLEELLRFLESIEIWVYLVVGLIGLISLQQLAAAWQEWRAALYGLERGSAQRKLSASLTVVVLMMLLALSEFLLVSFVSPTYPRAQILATPTVSLLTTPRPTRAATAVMTPTGFLPTLVVSGTDGCKVGLIEWTFPRPDGELQGTVILKGVVTVPNLGFFKYEYSSSGSSSWTTIAAGNQSTIKDGIWSGSWNTGQMVPGFYQLRLVVADNQNQTLPACVVNVRIIAP
jgi:hypothetical protein